MSFEKIIGQETARKILQGLLKRKIFNRTFLFYGPQGTGKFTTALVFSQGINCRNSNDNNPCFSCRVCLLTGNLKHPDLLVIDVGTSGNIKLEDSFRVHDFACTVPLEGRFKIVIIKDAHHFTTEAANNLLKILEDLPEYLAVILISSHPQLLLPTILSRAVKIQFFPLSQEQIELFLLENYEITEGRAHLLSGLSQGSLGKAIDYISGDLLINMRKSVINYLYLLKSNKLVDAFACLGIQDKDSREESLKKLEILSLLVRDLLMYLAGFNHLIINIDLERDIKEICEELDFEKTQECLLFIVNSIKSANDYNVNPSLFWDKITIKIKDYMHA
ncbi:MAG: DNA polymerase III subunit gamma/tau [candidate division WS2 bacterium]|nr:DNA polymerase III subunit gamma/tau [Candidatus Lithacetigena glycinireducens]MBT9174452.1 DNA polymerase III subunit gamma/tau [Candidatus Lithacetigena glycinireducens]